MIRKTTPTSATSETASAAPATDSTVDELPVDELPVDELPVDELPVVGPTGNPDATAGVTVRTGAGLSGLGSDDVAIWIHRTTSPDE